MLGLFKKMWWKYVSILLLLYVIVGGLLVPLGPGVTSVTPATIKPQSLQMLSIKGVNTHFKSAGDVQLFLKNGMKYYAANTVNAQSDNELSAVFAIAFEQQDSFEKQSFDIVINDNIDGTIALREGLTLIKADHFDSTLIANNFMAKITKPEVKQNKFTSFAFPYREILYQSIRNVFYHVPMWFGMMLVLIFSLVYSIKYLNSGNIQDDIFASEAVNTALLFGILGLLTGMMWANFTWGEPWPNDPKLNGAAVGVIIYFAYIVLRGSITDEIKRARISAVYNIFAVVIFVLFIFIIPRITDSLHPGNGGNPAFSKYDLDSHLRLFFYPAVIGWAGLALWIVSIRARIQILENKNAL